jgi:autotransporter adhesin
VNKGQLDGLDKKLSGGIAAGMAMVGNAPVEPGKSNLSVSVASYNGQVGYGASWAKRSIDGKWTASVSIGGATGGAKVGIRGTAGYTFD